jgi:uncharacterized lipoprotein
MHNGKIIFCSIILAGLTACVTTPSPEKVAKQTQIPRVPNQDAVESVQPVVVSGLDSNNIKDNYSIPDAAEGDSANNIAPPGSNLQQIQSQQLASNQANSVPAKAKSASFSGGSLNLNMPFAQAWSKVGKALSASGYQVMEKYDYSGTYYILDKTGTGGMVKRDTQIYQVHLQKNGDTTTVHLLNDKSKPADPAVSGRILSAVKNKL